MHGKIEDLGKNGREPCGYFKIEKNKMENLELKISISKNWMNSIS